MKKSLLSLLILTITTIVGCSKPTPEVKTEEYPTQTLMSMALTNIKVNDGIKALESSGIQVLWDKAKLKSEVDRIFAIPTSDKGIYILLAISGKSVDSAIIYQFKQLEDLQIEIRMADLLRHESARLVSDKNGRFITSQTSFGRSGGTGSLEDLFEHAAHKIRSPQEVFDEGKAFLKRGMGAKCDQAVLYLYAQRVNDAYNAYQSAVSATESAWYTMGAAGAAAVVTCFPTTVALPGGAAACAATLLAYAAARDAYNQALENRDNAYRSYQDAVDAYLYYSSTCS